MLDDGAENAQSLAGWNWSCEYQAVVAAEMPMDEDVLKAVAFRKLKMKFKSQRQKQKWR